MNNDITKIISKIKNTENAINDQMNDPYWHNRYEFIKSIDCDTISLGILIAALDDNDEYVKKAAANKIAVMMGNRLFSDVNNKILKLI